MIECEGEQIKEGDWLKITIGPETIALLGSTSRYVCFIHLPSASRTYRLSRSDSPISLFQIVPSER
jgi:hypothetical protein